MRNDCPLNKTVGSSGVPSSLLFVPVWSDIWLLVSLVLLIRTVLPSVLGWLLQKYSVYDIQYRFEVVQLEHIVLLAMHAEVFVFIQGERPIFEWLFVEWLVMIVACECAQTYFAFARGNNVNSAIVLAFVSRSHWHTSAEQSATVVRMTVIPSDRTCNKTSANYDRKF